MDAQPVAPVEVEEVQSWPGVWAATRTFAGWVLQADPAAPAEDTIGSARKVAERTGCSVVVEGLVIRP